MASRVAAVIDLIDGISGLGSISPPPIPGPAAAYPAITVHLTPGGREIRVLEGGRKCQSVFVQVNSFDINYEVADALRTSARNILMPFTGTSKGLVIMGSFHHLDADMYLDARKLHQCIDRYLVWFES